jgi:putative transposase
MARLPRFVIPNQPQHVILRGNDRKEVFCADEDYRFFLEKLELACKQFGCLVHAYVLMTNHVHLLITPTTEQALSKTMQSLGRHYVRYFNDTYRHSGTLWEGRYKATLIDSEAYLLTCMRYIEAWVLGDDGFKARIESQLNRRATPLGRGGDRKSELYRKINRV